MTNIIFQMNSSSVYVIVENNVFDVTKPYQVVSVTRSYEQALKYAGPNRSIEGPVPLLGDEPIIIEKSWYPPSEPVDFQLFKPQFHFDTKVDTKLDFNKPEKTGFYFDSGVVNRNSDSMDLSE